MHYKNGKEAKDGDRIIDLQSGLTGILHSTQAQSTTCNGRLAIVTPSDQYVTIGECVLLDDARAAFPDRSKAVDQGVKIERK